jgi:hypothetical protein
LTVLVTFETIGADKRDTQQEVRTMAALTGARDIEAFRLRTVIRAIRMEQAGMRNSRGNITPKWAKHLGLKARASHAEVIAAVEGLLAEVERGA